ncbi:MAG: (2E,6E)-farnesyl diphosphate synthase [Gammaproteobacteria bacterium]|nr:MAG: (2E,6E)-farnesyl diphosphate synthase [Gammaproteobacteria bacterium]
MAPLAVFMQTGQKRVERALDQYLPAETTLPQKLHQAMRYSTLNGGKRLRAILVYATGEALSIEPEQLDIAACAVELIHAYSLVHDDLPAMDDDQLRRGKPTCHIAFDEATALLTGDALQTLAFHLLCKPQTGLNAEHALKMIELLAHASGSYGMAGGQAVDLESTGKKLTLPELENMHIHKTGALIRASVKLAALSHPDLDPAIEKRLDHYAKCIGLAFQIQDDILDEESNTDTLGKTGGKDRANNKATYPSLLGLKGAKEKAVALHNEAINSLEPLDDKANLLRALSDFVIHRHH